MLESRRPAHRSTRSSIALLSLWTFFLSLPAAAASVTITDALGRSISFASPPARIAVAGRGVTQIASMLYMFPEARARVVAIPESTQPATEFLSLIDANIASKSLPGGSTAGPEQLAPHRPDVVVLKSAAADRLGTLFERIGIKVVYVEGESPDRFLADVTMLGKLLGNERRADEITTYFASQIRRVKDATRGIPAASRPRVLFLTVSTRGGDRAMNVPPADWLQTRMITDCGGAPVVDPAFPGAMTVTPEQVAAWNPDRILIAHYRGDSRDAVSRLSVDPVWKAIPAMRAGRVRAFPGDFYSWDQPDPRWILGELWLLRILHPGRARGIDMTHEIVTFYRTLYGLSEAQVRSNVVQRLTGDVGK